MDTAPIYGQVCKRLKRVTVNHRSHDLGAHVAVRTSKVRILPCPPYMLVCWNGRQGGLKIRCQKWRVGSSPTTSTKKRKKNMSILTELRNTNPKQLVANNQQIKHGFETYLSTVRQIYDIAQKILDEFFEETQSAAPSLPIPIKDIVKRCGCMILENKMADTESMERDENGNGRRTIAQIQIRECHFANIPGEIASTIQIDKNLSEYAKRFAIAHEFGHYVLRTIRPVGPLYIKEPCYDNFAYAQIDEFLADKFAYAIMLPYELIKRRKKRYEKENQYNPISYIDWIQTLENEAQIPQLYVILAYEEIKKRHLAEITQS